MPETFSTECVFCDRVFDDKNEAAYHDCDKELELYYRQVKALESIATDLANIALKYTDIMVR